MSDPSNEQIAAFSDLLSASRSRVFGYIYAMLHNMSDAEDVYQQTTVLLWQKFPEYEAGSSFASWALQVAYYNVKNFQRSQSQHRRFFSDAVMEKVAASYGDMSDGESSDRLESLLNCLGKLSPAHQQLLKKRYADGVTVKRLAEEVGKTEPAMAMALSRVRRVLERCIRSQLARA